MGLLAFFFALDNEADSSSTSPQQHQKSEIQSDQSLKPESAPKSKAGPPVDSETSSVPPTVINSTEAPSLARAIFDDLDTDHSGVIDRDELENAFERMGLLSEKMSREKRSKRVDALVRMVDVTGDGEIDFDEFQQAFGGLIVEKSKKSRANFSHNVSSESVPVNDKSNNARKHPPQNLEHLIHRLEKKLAREWLDRSLHEVDTGSDIAVMGTHAKKREGTALHCPKVKNEMHKLNKQADKKAKKDAVLAEKERERMRKIRELREQKKKEQDICFKQGSMNVMAGGSLRQSRQTGEELLQEEEEKSDNSLRKAWSDGKFHLLRHLVHPKREEAGGVEIVIDNGEEGDDVEESEEDQKKVFQELGFGYRNSMVAMYKAKSSLRENSNEDLSDSDRTLGNSEVVNKKKTSDEFPVTNKPEDLLLVVRKTTSEKLKENQSQPADLVRNATNWDVNPDHDVEKYESDLKRQEEKHKIAHPEHKHKVKHVHEITFMTEDSDSFVFPVYNDHDSYHQHHHHHDNHHDTASHIKPTTTSSPPSAPESELVHRHQVEDFSETEDILDHLHYADFEHDNDDDDEEEDLEHFSFFRALCGREHDHSHFPMWYYVFAGGLSGVFSRTIVAPLETIKIRLQTGLLKQRSSSSNSSQTKNTRTSVLRMLHKTYLNQGVRGLFAGNMLNCLRVFPLTGLSCLFYIEIDEKIIQQYNEYQAIRIRREVYNDYSEDDFDEEEIEQTAGQKFMAGFVAGAFANLLTYPLDVVRARMSVSNMDNIGNLKSVMSGETVTANNSKPSTTKAAANKRVSLYQITKETWKNKAGFQGLGITILTAAGMLGIQQGVYDAIKKEIVMDRALIDPGATSFALIGGFAGIASQVAMYPFDTIRRRIQVGDLLARDGETLLNDPDSGKKIKLNNSSSINYRGRIKYKTSGIMGMMFGDGVSGFKKLYRGIGPACVKVLPAVGVNLVVRDWLLGKF